MKSHLRKSDRVFIELPKCEHLMSFKFSATKPTRVHFMNALNREKLLNGTLEQPVLFIITGTMENTTILNLNNTIITPYEYLSVNLKSDFPVIIMIENTEHDIEFSVDLEEVEYIPARVERRPMIVPGDLPF